MLTQMINRTQALVESLDDTIYTNRELRATQQILRQSIDRLRDGVGFTNESFTAMEELEMQFHAFRRSVRCGLCDQNSPGRYTTDEWRAVKMMFGVFTENLSTFLEAEESRIIL